MSTPSGWQRRLLLIFKSEKRLGAKQIQQDYATKSYEQMKQHIISATELKPVDEPDRARIKDLRQHLDKVKLEFVNQPELSFYHASLIILLRRDYKIAETFALFEQLWEQETDYLLAHLNLRWLISACDTFIDHSSSPLRAAILLNAVTLINTLKVYETTQYLQIPTHPHAAFMDEQQARLNTDIPKLIEQNVNALYQAHLPLYKGLTYFRLGRDDTLKNMRLRYEKFYDTDHLAASMLLSIFDKLQTSHTGFFILRTLHKDERSQWWLDSTEPKNNDYT